MVKRNVTLRDVGKTLEEHCAEIPSGQFSMGVGIDLKGRTRLSGSEITDSLCDVFCGMQDGAGSKGFINGVVFYMYRRGNTADVGTRADFADIDLTIVCDLLDTAGTGDEP